MILSLITFLSILKINHNLIEEREERSFRMVALLETIMWIMVLITIKLNKGVGI